MTARARAWCRGAAVLAVGAAAFIGGCGAPPWRMGSPLDGRPSIPPGSARPTAEQARATAARDRAAGRTVLELMALLQIDGDDKLTGADRARLVDLLAARAAEFHGLGRPIPESSDLEEVARLDPARGARLVTARAVAAVAAGDAWKAIGARAEARAAFNLATSLGERCPAISACARRGRRRRR